MSVHLYHFPAQPRLQFLCFAKITLLLAIVYMVISLVKQVGYFGKITPYILEYRIVENGRQPPDSATANDLSNTETSDASKRQQTGQFSVNEGIKVSEFRENCGLPHPCESNEFPVHIFTGIENRVWPRLCIDGKYVLDKNLNGCGRGINVAVLDNISRSILTVANYDTYDKESTSFETMLLTLRPGDIIILLTYDEPATKLSQVARLLLHELGSGMAQNLQYRVFGQMAKVLPETELNKKLWVNLWLLINRTSWYLITQKGINGYSPYEQIHLPESGGWGHPHDIHKCFPFKFTGMTVQPDRTAVENKPRRRFCSKYASDWPLFCGSHVVNEPLLPSSLLRPLPVSSELLSTPIIVLCGQTLSSNEYLPLTLETIIRQPGIKPKNVIVFLNRTCCPSTAPLIDIFGFMSEFYSDDYTEKADNLLTDVLDTVRLLFPDSRQYIILDKNVVLSPDFLPFFGQLLPVLHFPNSSVVAISGWNDNGYAAISHEPCLVFRAKAKNYRPRFAVMFKKDADLLASESWSASWSFGDFRLGSDDEDILVPDLSRTFYVVPSEGDSLSEEEKVFIRNYMAIERAICTEEETQLTGTDALTTNLRYEQRVLFLVNQSIKIESTQIVHNFIHNNSPKIKLANNSILSIFCGNEAECQSYCDVFSLSSCSSQKYIRSLGGIIRFTLSGGVEVFLVQRHVNQLTSE